MLAAAAQQQFQVQSLPKAPSKTEIATGLLKRFASGTVSLVTAPIHWLSQTSYYYLIGYGEGSQAPSNWSWTYSAEDLSRVYNKTFSFLREGYYPFNGKQVECRDQLNTAIEKTEKLKLNILSGLKSFEGKETTKMSLIRKDPIQVGFELKKEGLNPVLVNPAHPTIPGSGYKLGCKGLEEELFRRSGLSFAIDRLLDRRENTYYPIDTAHHLYTPDCPFIRHGHDQQYALLPQPETLSVLSSPPIDMRTGKESKRFEEETTKIVYGQLYAAASKQHDAIVLTDFGCSNFNNDPTKIAQIYKDTLESDKFKKVFKNVTFAVSDANFKAFYDVFVKVKTQ